MMLRFWRPGGDPPDAELNLVVVVASKHLLYTILEGPPLQLAPPRFKGDPEWRPPEMLYVRIVTASGVDLLSHGGGSYGGGNGATGLEPRTHIMRTVIPPDPTDLPEPLTVQLLREDSSIIWEVQAFPVG